MKKYFFLAILSFSLLMFNSLMASQFEYVESDDRTLYSNYMLEIDSQSARIKNNEFSVRKWWKNRPEISPVFISGSTFESEILKILRENGYIINDDANPVIFEIKEVKDGFIFVKIEYGENRIDNSTKLFPKNEFVNQARGFLSVLLPPFENDLPKLLILLTEQNVETDFFPLFRSENAYVFLTEKSELSLKINDIENKIGIPNTPITVARILDRTHELSLISETNIKVSVDDKPYDAPVTLHLTEGIHTLEFRDEKRYIYIEDDMKIKIDTGLNFGKAVFSSTVPATLTVSDEHGNFICERYFENNLVLELEEGTYGYTAYAPGFKTEEHGFRITYDEETSVSLNFKGLPGTVKFRKLLNDKFDSILLNDDLIILTKENSSVIFDNSGKHENIVQERIKNCTNNYYYSNSSVYDNSHNLIFNSNDSIIKIVEYDDSVLIFDSNFNLSGYSKILNSISWERVVDYVPWEVKRAGDYLVILDIMSRLIILNKRTGYSEIFDERKPGTIGIRIEELTPDYIRIYISGIEEVLEYYFGNRQKRSMKYNAISDDESDYSDKNIKLSDENTFDLKKYGDGLIDFYENENLIGILTEDFFEIVYK